VLITHQMEVVREVCDRVAVLAQGQVVELGRTIDVFATPRHDVTRAMVSAATATDLSDATLQAVQARMRDAALARPDAEVRLLRLSLGGDAGAGTLISDLARRFALDISVVQARIDDVQGTAVGTAFVLAQGPAQALQQALADLSARDIPVQELAYESRTDQPAVHVAA
jgi:D-methionine transport system ATP-binding protein